MSSGTGGGGVGSIDKTKHGGVDAVVVVSLNVLVRGRSCRCRRQRNGDIWDTERGRVGGEAGIVDSCGVMQA